MENPVNTCNAGANHANGLSRDVGFCSQLQSCERKINRNAARDSTSLSVFMIVTVERVSGSRKSSSFPGGSV